MKDVGLGLAQHTVLGCIHLREVDPGLAGFSIGYESGIWRDKDAVELLLNHLPKFALRHSELQNITAEDIYPLLLRAAQAVYTTDRHKRRGELGELLLHTVLTRQFDTIPAISKLYYKDGPNETVKGFDAVHVVATDSDLELWLGEVKFYADYKQAATDVIKELHEHTERNYLREEFRFVSHKIDDTWPHAERLRMLLDEKVSLDHIFDRVRIPVLLTYNSVVTTSHTTASDEFVAELRKEFDHNYSWFCDRELPTNVRLYLLLVPMQDKQRLNNLFDQRLKRLQDR